MEMIRRNGSAATGAAILLVIVGAILAANLVTGYSPIAFDLLHRLGRPTIRHPFGTDLFGRDVFSRVIFGGRYTLLIGVGVAGAALVVGVTAGTLAGFLGGIVDTVVMRLVDALLSFPALVLAIALAAALGPSLISAMVAVSITQAPQFARIARGQAMQIASRSYVEAAVSIGVPSTRILTHYVLRNGAGPLLTQAPLSIASVILQTASLGFLGLGAQPPTPEWGADIASNLEYIEDAPWVIIAPGVAILLTVLSFNLIGDSLAQTLNPRGRGRR
jgi:peptide/nickel transport system permease protein